MVSSSQKRGEIEKDLVDGPGKQLPITDAGAIRRESGTTYRPRLLGIHGQAMEDRG